MELVAEEAQATVGADGVPFAPQTYGTMCVRARQKATHCFVPGAFRAMPCHWPCALRAARYRPASKIHA